MYAPKSRQELADILEALQDYAAVEELSAVTEVLADARLHLAMAERRPLQHRGAPQGPRRH